jgi:hypothetical protein
MITPAAAGRLVGAGAAGVILKINVIKEEV